MIKSIIVFFCILFVGCSVLSEMSNINPGLIGWTVENQEHLNKKQTYLDYVQERLEVERLLK